MYGSVHSSAAAMFGVRCTMHASQGLRRSLECIQLTDILSVQLVMWDLLRGLHIRGGPQKAALRPQVSSGVHRPLVPVIPGLLAACGVPNLQCAAVPDSDVTCASWLENVLCM